MGLRDLVRNLTSVADRLTAGLQDTVVMDAWTGYGIQGEALFDSPPVSIQAVVNYKQYKRTLASGEVVEQKASILIPRPIAPNGAAERREPIDPRDSFTLPNGYTGPILGIEAPNDPGTHHAFVYEVVLG